MARVAPPRRAEPPQADAAATAVVAERPVTLADLDALDGDCLGLFCWADRQPLAGVAALVDWRVCGALSRALLAERFVGARAESMMLPVTGRFGPRRLFALGLGPQRGATPELAAEMCGLAVDIMARAGAQRPLLAAAASAADPEVEQAFVRAARACCAGRIAQVLSERRA